MTRRNDCGVPDGLGPGSCRALPRIACLLASVAFGLFAGCTPFNRPLASATTAASPKLSWLTQWVAAPLETSPGFDPELLKTPVQRRDVATEDLLEVTVWDLYEPGKPHTYPVRVSPELKIEAPLLGEISVAGQKLSDIERHLAAQYREREILLTPRLLVRSLDAPMLKVHVAGAVSQSGFVEVPREEPTVYTALLSAGGLRKNAGTQIGIQRRREVDSAGARSVTESASPAPVVDPAPKSAPSPGRTEPVSLANSVEVLSVSTATVAPADAESPAEPPAAERGTQHTPGSSPTAESHGISSGGEIAGPETGWRWYDVSQASDLAALREVVLNQGDEILVKSAAPPIRVSGMVHRPGPYSSPNGKKINVWQALELAGGVSAPDVPLNLTLYRPAGEGHGSQRWYLHLDSIDQRPAAAPTIEPGDILHVEPTTASRIKRAVGDLWNKS